MPSDGLRITFTPFVFPDQTEPNGLLVRDMGCQACWYYYVLAHKQWALVGNSIDDQFGILEGNPWLSKRYEGTARNVAMIYGLKDPSEFMKYWPLVAMECHRMGMTAPQEEYMKPLRFILDS